jgi:hypothetical protein
VKRLGVFILLLGTESALAADEPYELSTGELAAIQTAVQKRLTNPQSANFETVKSIRREKHGLVTTCGLVKSKEGTSGKLAFSAFMVLTISNEPFVIALENEPDKARDVLETCKRAGLPF